MVKLPDGGKFSPYFISQSQGGLLKVWVKLICMFVEQISPPWCMRMVKMQEGGEFITLCRVVKTFMKWLTENAKSTLNFLKIQKLPSLQKYFYCVGHSIICHPIC